MDGHRADPLSRNQIRKSAYKFRNLINSTNDIFIDVIRLLEILLPEIGGDFEVLPRNELKAEAISYPNEKKVCVREDVYDAAANNDGRARFTIMHEIGHLIFHSSERVSYARNDEKLPTYCDPEWQASAFAGEFLMPYHLVKEMSVEEVMRKCGVSRSAAEFQLRQYKKDRLM